MTNAELPRNRPETLEEKVDVIYDYCIRMEPVIDDVSSLKKWRDGNSWPGARFQVYVLWAVFVAILAKVF